MATYVDQDIASTFGGDIILSSKGDLKIADSLETHKAAANFLLRTDYGDYAADKTVGCILGSFIGELNPQANHDKMELLINRGLQSQIFSTEDVLATVVPFDINEALCVVQIVGNYLVSGEIVYAIDQKISYLFPYIEGEPTPLVI
jgi:hypothetical protein